MKEQMNFVHLSLNPVSEIYRYTNSSNTEMYHLGLFFIADVGCDGSNPFRQWAIKSTDDDRVSGNYGILENECGHILLSDEYPAMPTPTKLRMTKRQFVQLCDDWQEKVVKRKPKEVTIKYEQGEFFIETSN